MFGKYKHMYVNSAYKNYVQLYHLKSFTYQILHVDLKVQLVLGYQVLLVDLVVHLVQVVQVVHVVQMDLVDLVVHLVQEVQRVQCYQPHHVDPEVQQVQVRLHREKKGVINGMEMYILSFILLRE